MCAIDVCSDGILPLFIFAGPPMADQRDAWPGWTCCEESLMHGRDGLAAGRV